MNDEDFLTFRTIPEIELVSPIYIMFIQYIVVCLYFYCCCCRCRFKQSLLGDVSHRLLSAAQAAKMGVIYSQYNSFYVLTGVVSHSVSFSLAFLAVNVY